MVLATKAHRRRKVLEVGSVSGLPSPSLIGTGWRGFSNTASRTRGSCVSSKKWLSAGVIENGTWTPCDEGTPQGASVSPLLANVYLHYVLDQWAHQWRKRYAHGDVVMVRWADDVIVGFEHHGDAEQFLADLRERFAKFALELQAEKTRLIMFGRMAAQQQEERGLGRPETFDFLGFTHACGKTKSGRFMLKRVTI